jgi:RNA polymerase sigma factor (sigma-70 family)
VSARPRAATVEHLLRELTPQVLGAVTRRHNDFAAAEDAVQEALIAAALQWTEAGVPDNPGGWLYQVAVRRLTDHVRSEVARRRREEIVASQQLADQPFVSPDTGDTEAAQDDTLVLLFMCCHPALTPPSAIALTLRAIGGLTTAAIAHAFLVPEATMAQRISRAKQRIKTSGVVFRLPSEAERVERLGAVLQVLYLIFNEGYTSSSGPQLQRADLAAEAIRLARLAHELLPEEGEVAGLLALMLLTDARRAAREGPHGELIPLDEQDRTRWNQQQIVEGIALLTGTLGRGAVGPYQVQAAIAAVHDEAARAEETDWPQLLALYELLMGMVDNPMVALSHAVAAAMVHEPVVGLERVAQLDGDARLAGHYRLDAVRAHLLERAGEHAAAVTHYRRAATRTTSLAERNYLLLKAARLTDAHAGS